MARTMPASSYAPGELIVAFHETTSEARINEIVKQEEGRIERLLIGERVYLITLPEETDVEKAAERFSSFPEVRYAEPNYRAERLEKK